MFNTLYRCPRTIARHENGPLAESRRRYRHDTTPEPDVVLNCVSEEACFQEWTLFKDSALDLSFEELSRLPDLEFVGKDAVHVHIFTIGDEETTARLVRALNHLIAQLQALTKTDATDPFAK